VQAIVRIHKGRVGQPEAEFRALARAGLGLVSAPPLQTSLLQPPGPETGAFLNEREREVLRLLADRPGLL